ncbi:pilus (MSHA type) biogenesis protein MshL [Desulfomarina profundi]|uniref:Pilus (MSHA type) biogenesis protein MshL n=1 Tax=Desulfomarina profundi TaxID=2772557 RepID=A0A8D5FJ43_9BACT|nr:pilus (MSHA type) biogenesis protein MshL [Desulfomarina profundi]BCL61516.1 pilus (MSHA type) biogenesis protein MshL [Desulfomarina profundi]
MLKNYPVPIHLTLILLLCFTFAGCGQKKKDSSEIKPVEQITRVTAPRSVTPPVQEKPAGDLPAPAPRFKKLSPLDNERLSMSFIQEEATRVLQALAHAASLNLVLSTEITLNRQITAEYQEMTIRSILDATCRMLNVVWYEKHGTIYIEPYARKMLDLDFLASVRKSSFKVGGDVLGVSSGQQNQSTSSPLSGHYGIEGGADESISDIYGDIEKTIGKMIGSNGSFAINRQTGTLMVKARPDTMEDVEQYIAILRNKYRRQVLIEAKIIEVGLSKKHQLGIDWRNVGGLISKHALLASSGATVTIAPSVSQTDSFYSMNISSKYSNMNGIFRALEEYGTLTVLSNPRLKTMNGQAAMLSVGQSVSYLRSFEQNSEGTGDNRTTDFTTEIGSVFDGILLGVTPVIEDDDMVSLHIVPIKSDLVKLETVSFGSLISPYQLTLPTVNLRELSTVSRIHSGDIVLLGGLIMEFDDKEETSIPILSDLPLFGRLFSMETKEKKKVEMVVVLQVHIVDQNRKDP